MIKINITLPYGYGSKELFSAISAVIPVTRTDVYDIEVLKRELVLSDVAPMYKCTVALSLTPEREAGLLKMRNKVKEYTRETFYAPPAVMRKRPIVVGSGPSGLFAALALAEAGTSPIILERGSAVRERLRRVGNFLALGRLDTECNIQFGEGGAGTFSDGKLKFGAADPYKRRIADEFIAAGADPEIAYSSTAHLGTDRLVGIVEKIREKIISLGGEFIFDAKFTELLISSGKVVGVIYEKNGETVTVDTDTVILAIGHSARDTIRKMAASGVIMTPRPFGVGMRIEHPREYINGIVYKNAAPIIKESASYHLVTHLAGGRSVYSFCMCPGGEVVAATSENGSVVTNGMSEYRRDAENSNAAILVSVTPRDFGGAPLSGIEYQERIEKAAYNLTGSYAAPTSRLDAFMKGGYSTDFASTRPSYKLGTVGVRHDDYLPSYITDSIRTGMLDFDAWLPGFNLCDAILTGPETRTTSPIRMERGESGEALGIEGLYPSGEGAGYAGGIISASRDGLLAADKLLKKHSKA